MNRRWHFDAERGLAAIRRSPDARDYPTVDQVKAWMGSGIAPPDRVEPDRCPTCGREWDCICLDCEYCGPANAPRPPWRRRSRPRTDPTGTEQ